MWRARILLGTSIVAAMLSADALASPLRRVSQGWLTDLSPDRRFVVRNEDRVGSASDFNGSFHSLWLFESATGRARKLCHYLGVAAVAWAKNDFLVITE